MCVCVCVCVCVLTNKFKKTDYQCYLKLWLMYFIAFEIMQQNFHFKISGGIFSYFSLFSSNVDIIIDVYGIISC